MKKVHHSRRHSTI